MSLIFYDTETSGLSSAFDQILQFAAIRTDDDLNEIGRFEIRSRLLPYIIPSPARDEGDRADHRRLCSMKTGLHIMRWSLSLGGSLARGVHPRSSATIRCGSMRSFCGSPYYQCLHPPYHDQHRRVADAPTQCT